MSKALKMVRKFFPEVETVKDATKGVIVEVTPHDVKNSERRKHKVCAMAVACKRMMNLDGVIMGISMAYTIKGKVATRHEVSPSLGREITSFDRSGDFLPGSYSLSPVVPTNRLGSKGGAHTKRGTSKPIKFRHLTENIRAHL